MDDVAVVRSATPFIGRAAELERLRELLSGSVAGTSAAVLLAGDAGVGKTSVATEFGRYARASGAIVLTGRNVELGSGSLPYLPLSEALAQVLRAGRAAADQDAGPDDADQNTAGSDDAVNRAVAARDIVLGIAQSRPSLARLIGQDDPRSEQRAADADLERLALFEAVSETLSRIAGQVAPLVLVIEDLHWAEQSTRDLVRFMLSRLGTDPLLILITYRADDLHRRHPVRALLAELVRLPAVELIELHPFNQAELTAFLESVQGSEVPDSVVRRISERSSGNAFFAQELLSAPDGDERLPSALADILIERLERLPAPTQQLVRVASAIGAFRIEDQLLRAAAEAAGLSAVATDAALRDAVAQLVLGPDDADGFSFRHALLQEAIYDDLLPGERVRLHAVMARLLAERDGRGDGSASGDAAEQARHALAAHDLVQALSASVRAARTALRRLAPAEALAQFEQALQLWPVVDPARWPAGEGLVSLTIAAADTAGNAGLRERAVALAQDAVRAAQEALDRDGSARARACLAVHLYAVDRGVESIAAAQAVIDQHPGAQPGPAPSPTPALVSARAILARSLISNGDPEAALTVVRAGLPEARALNMRAEEADMQMTWSGASYMLGQPDASEHQILAGEAAQASGDPGMMMRVSYWGLIDRFEAGDFDAVLGLIAENLALAEQAGLSSSLYATQCRWMLVNAQWMRGDPEAALAAVKDAGAVLPMFGSRQLLHAGLPILAARDPQEALRQALELDEAVPLIGDAPERWAAKAAAHAWLGDPDRSVEASAAAIDSLDALGEPWALMGIAVSTDAVGVYAGIAAAARSAGDETRSAAAVSGAQRFIDDAHDRARHGRPRRYRMGSEGLAWLARLDAEQARLTGSDSAEQWQATVEAFEKFGMVYETARARWRLAQRLLTGGTRDDARAQLALARSAAEQLEAQPLLAELDDLARRGRLASSTVSSAPTAPAGARLTARERDVMRLVAQGLTNRAIGDQLFISEKTASVHVSNVLTKLGASGRTEAVAIATRENLL